MGDAVVGHAVVRHAVVRHALWETINQNRTFFDRLSKEREELVDYNDLLEGVE